MQRPELVADETRIRQALELLPTALATGMPIALWARALPDAPASIGPWGQQTFAQLNARSNQLARALRGLGIESGDSVALMCRNRSEFAEVFWATRRTGLRLTTINWHLTGDEAAYIVDDCDAKAFFIEQGFDDAARVVAAQAGKLRLRVAIGGSLTGHEDYEALLREHSGRDIENPRLGTQMLYTSGTTGRPKGVFRPAIVPPASAMTSAASYEAGRSVHLLTGPLYHAAPLAFSLATPQAYGAAVVMMDGWNAERALQLIEQHRVTHTHMVPTMFHRLLALPEATRKQAALHSLQFVLHGAAPCSVPLKQALLDWLGPIVHEYYAATEGTGTYVDPHTWLKKPGTVGRPTPSDHVKIMDESGDWLPPNQTGLVYLKAPAAARFTYYKDHAKTKQAYRDEYYTLGDLGYIDEDGYLFLTDRSANLIITGGVNVYPAEVESVLLTHPAIEDVGVIGVPNAEWGEEVKAVATLRAGHVGSPQLSAELIEYCRARLAHFKCPRSVDFVEQLPRYDNGKLYKQKLRDSYRPQV